MGTSYHAPVQRTSQNRSNYSPPLAPSLLTNIECYGDIPYIYTKLIFYQNLPVYVCAGCAMDVVEGDVDEGARGDYVIGFVSHCMVWH